MNDRPGQLDESLVRIAEAYDELPYESKPFPQTHPARTGAIAHLFGLSRVPLERARVLELGCAAGGNIIPIAARYPDARFLGIDLGLKQVEEGRERVARAGLGNIEIRHQSITDLGAEEGEFDYIICHGVYSWVPEPVREAILAICGRHLSAEGIACVSYNVSPGWRLYQPLRDAFRLLIPHNHPPATRVKMARQLLDFMKEMSPDRGSYGDMLRASPARLARYGDDYLFHDYMEEENMPTSISDFMGAASRHGLGYLGECDIDLMIASNFGEDFAERLAARMTPDVLSYEQMIDVLTGRPFRSTLIVRKERVGQIRRQLTPDRVRALHFTPSQQLKVQREKECLTLTEAKGRSLKSTNPAVTTAIERFLGNAPASSSFAQLTASMTEDMARSVENALYRMVVAGIIDFSVEPMEAAKASNSPVAHPLVRADAASGSALTANARHEGVRIEGSALVLLPHMDGTLNRPGMEKLLFDAAREGRITFRHNNTPVTEPRPLREAIHGLMPNILHGIAQSGVLVA